MTTLEELLSIHGVVGAFEFTPDGTLLQCTVRQDMSPEEAESSAQFCQAVTLLFNSDPGPFTPPCAGSPECRNCWVCARRDWLVVTGRERGVFAEGTKADVQRLIEAVTG